MSNVDDIMRNPEYTRRVVEAALEYEAANAQIPLNIGLAGQALLRSLVPPGPLPSDAKLANTLVNTTCGDVCFGAKPDVCAWWTDSSSRLQSHRHAVAMGLKLAAAVADEILEADHCVQVRIRTVVHTRLCGLADEMKSRGN